MARFGSRLQLVPLSASVGRLAPLCCFPEGKEGTGARSSKARQGLGAWACGFPPASVRVRGCSAGLVDP